MDFLALRVTEADTHWVTAWSQVLDADELARLLAMFPAEVGAGKTNDYLNELFGMTSKH